MTDDELGVIERDCGPGPASTHWDGCHRSHPRCAVLALVAEVRRLRAAVAAEREWAAGVCDGYAAMCRRVDGPGDDQAAACLTRAAAAIRRGPEPAEGV